MPEGWTQGLGAISTTGAGNASKRVEGMKQLTLDAK